MNQPILSITAPDGSIAFKDYSTGQIVGYAGCAEFVANILISCDWMRAYGSPTQEAGYFIAVPQRFEPEQIPLESGFVGWHKMDLDELLDFVDGDGLAIH